MLSDFSSWLYSKSSLENMFPTGDSRLSTLFGISYFTKYPSGVYDAPGIYSPSQLLFHKPKNLLSSISILLVSNCISSFCTVSFVVSLLSICHSPVDTFSISSSVASGSSSLVIPSSPNGYSIVLPFL